MPAPKVMKTSAVPPPEVTTAFQVPTPEVTTTSVVPTLEVATTSVLPTPEVTTIVRPTTSVVPTPACEMAELETICGEENLIRDSQGCPLLCNNREHLRKMLHKNA